MLRQRAGHRLAARLPDALARLDLDTARRVPWDDSVPFFLGEFVNADGSPYPVCPRQTLKRVLKRARSSASTSMAGMEFEWFNFAETPADLGRQARRRPDDADARACSATRCCAWPTTASSSTR